jgi:hypothetical protein
VRGVFGWHHCPTYLSRYLGLVELSLCPSGHGMPTSEPRVLSLPNERICAPAMTTWNREPAGQWKVGQVRPLLPPPVGRLRVACGASQVNGLHVRGGCRPLLLRSTSRARPNRPTRKSPGGCRSDFDRRRPAVQKAPVEHFWLPIRGPPLVTVLLWPAPCFASVSHVAQSAWRMAPMVLPRRAASRSIVASIWTHQYSSVARIVHLVKFGRTICAHTA